MQAASAGKFTVLVLYSSQTDSLTEVILQSFLPNVSANNIDLQLVVHDLNSSSCDEEEATAVGTFICEIFEKEIGAVAVIGPSCTDSAYAISRLISRGALPMIHLHTSPMPEQLAAQVEEKSFGLLGPVDLLADASIALMQHANWSRIIALYQDTNTDMNFIFLRMQKLLSSPDSNTILGYSSLVHEGNTRLKFVLSRYAIRIIFLMTDKELARSILCVGYHLEVVYPAYQWVIIRTMPHDLITDEPVCTESYECNKENMLTVLKKAIFIGFEDFSSPMGSSDESLFKNSIYHMTIKFLSQAFHYYENVTSSSLVQGYALSQVQQDLAKQQVFFIQIRDNSKLFPVALYDETDGIHIKRNSTLYLTPSNFTKIINVVELHIFTISTVILVILSAIIATLQFLTILYRKRKHVRAISPNLQHLAYLGVYLVTLATFVYIIQKSLHLRDETYTHFCSMYQFCLSFGFTLSFGTLCVKAWRLYRIINHYMDPGKFLSDKILVLVVLSFITVDFVLCILLIVVGKPVRAEMSIKTDFKNKVETVNKVCRTNYIALWYALIVSYQFIILLFSMIFAALTKNKKSSLHHLRRDEVALLAYILTAIFLVGSPTYLIIHFITGDLLYEFIVTMAIHFSIIVAYIVLLFASPLIHTMRYDKDKKVI